MVDFKISNSGDIVLANSRQFPRMRVDFVASTFPAMRIQFLQDAEEYNRQPEAMQCLVRFHTKSRDLSNGSLVVIVSDEEEIQQRILLALRTEYGDIITKPDFGSNVFRIKHLDIQSSTVQRQLEDAILAEIQDILDDPGVVVKPEKYDGVFYCQNINAYIYDGDELVYEFSIAE